MKDQTQVAAQHAGGHQLREQLRLCELLAMQILLGIGRQRLA